jgi:hypothetical protein
MTKSRLIYLIIMIIALLGLGWDKFINPNSATNPLTSQAESTQTRPTDSKEDMSQWTQSPFVQRVLNQQIQKTNSPLEAPDRNLFAPNDQFRQNTYRTPHESLESKDFSNLRLTTISKGSDQDHVLINSQLVKIGEAIGPYRLIKINREEIVLHKDKQHITLPIGQLTQSEADEKIIIFTCDLSDCFSN